MSGSRLAVWKGQDLIGSLDSTRSGIRFTYETAEVERVGIGRPLVSMSLPTSLRPYANKACLPFFDGLLPEGEARRIISYDLGIAESDTFGLIKALGRDCAGALAILGDDAPPPKPCPVESLTALDYDAIAQRIASLRFQPLGIDGAVRVSLGGVQEKLLLTRRPDGRWALPTSAVASTHILKPAIGGLESCVANEAICLAFAAELGVRAAATNIEQVGDRDVLVVARFDRRIEPDGTVTRLHQETACQALAVPIASTTRKYEDAGGPNLQAVSAMVRRWGTPSDVEELLRQLTVNVLVGNADAHAMNTSFTIGDDGTIALAPMYDVFSTLAYRHLTTTPGMFIDSVKDLRAIGRVELVNEAVNWGIESTRAEDVVNGLFADSKKAMRAALAKIERVPKWLSKHLSDRINALR